MKSLAVLGRLEPLWPVLLGVIAFLMVVGPRALDPQDIGWLPPGDSDTHYFGWHFFRNGPWTLPFGLNPNYGLELSNAILYSDSIPLLAFLFKPFGAFLPETFQYFGLWLLLCFVLQAWLAWNLTGLISANPLIRVLGAGLFVFAPPMLWRIQCHFSLVGHFFILAALYLALRPRQDHRVVLWAALVTAVTLVHAYLLAMVLLLWLADLVQAGLDRRLTWRAAVREASVVFTGLFLAAWQAGYFTVGSSFAAGGYGFYRLGLLSLIDPSGWSWLLPDLPEADGDYEGFNYLGLGLLFAAVWALAQLGRRSLDLGALPRRWPMLTLSLLGLTLFAVTNQIGLGAWTFELPLPAWSIEIANVFRGSGRLFWPVFYTLLLAILFIIVRVHPPRVAVALLALALTLQIADTSAKWWPMRLGLTQAQPTWTTPLIDPFWEQAARHYSEVRFIRPVNQGRHWQVFAQYAARHGLATNTVYLARVGAAQQADADSQATQAVLTGRYRADSLYILDDNQVLPALAHLDRRSDLMARIDGYNIIAPGFRRYPEGRAIEQAHGLDAVLPPPPRQGERIGFAPGDPGTRYLLTGWSGPESWGTWSAGETADIVLPAVAGRPTSVLIEANPLITDQHPRQRLEIRVNGGPPFAFTLTERLGNRIRVPLSPEARARLERQGYLNLNFTFDDAVRPRTLGLGFDDRLLALGLVSIVIE